jgi:hypothetical protein
MKLLALIVLSIASYVATLLLLERIFLVASESQLYWLCFAVSISVLGAGLFAGFRRAKASRIVATAALLASLLLVVVGDIAFAVWYSCAKGVCI